MLISHFTVLPRYNYDRRYTTRVTTVWRKHKHQGCESHYKISQSSCQNILVGGIASLFFGSFFSSHHPCYQLRQQWSHEYLPVGLDSSELSRCHNLQLFSDSGRKAILSVIRYIC